MNKYISKASTPLGKLEETVHSQEVLINQLLKENKRLKAAFLFADVGKGSKTIRSVNQNKYYWSVIVPACSRIMRESGMADSITRAVAELMGKEFILFDEKMAHEFLKRSYGLTTTTQEDTKEFEQYLEWCRAWAADKSTIIALPNELI